MLQWHLMKRREFIKRVGLGLAASWAGGRRAWPWRAWARGPELRLALVADAHLKDGDDRRPEAMALARAVAEIRQLWPPPDLVLFAGDLAHRGRPDALDLGREILGDLPAPVWAVIGEGDHGPGIKAAWVWRFGESRFSRAYQGVQVIGLETSLSRTSRGRVFEIGAAQCQWLARELARLTPTTPLVVLSHAPLAHLFYPWQQWTADASEVARLLARFSRVVCVHGHVHGAGIGEAVIKGQGSGARNDDNHGNNFGSWSLTENRKPETKNPLIHCGLPATSFPRPQAVQGTPMVMRPGLGPRGCGWALVSLRDHDWYIFPNLWQT
jgi:Icc-related predicted phosphoesterase